MNLKLYSFLPKYWYKTCRICKWSLQGFLRELLTWNSNMPISVHEFNHWSFWIFASKSNRQAIISLIGLTPESGDHLMSLKTNRSDIFLYSYSWWKRVGTHSCLERVSEGVVKYRYSLERRQGHFRRTLIFSCVALKHASQWGFRRQGNRRPASKANSLKKTKPASRSADPASVDPIIDGDGRSPWKMQTLPKWFTGSADGSTGGFLTVIT